MAPAKRKREPRPFTVPHFKRWARENELTLDTGEDFNPARFQLEIVKDIFAGFPGNPARRPAGAGFREIWVLIPEGNAKTTLMGLVSLYGADHTSSPWIPIGAASRDQAEILFGQAGGFVERSAQLRSRFRVYEGYRKISHRQNGGRGIKVYAADKATGDGVIPYPFAFVDEGHRHRDLGLYRTWKGKLRKRGAQIVAISTAGEPGTDFENTRDQIREQATSRKRRGPAYLRAEGGGVVLHEWKVPSPDKARDLRVVKAANPLPTITIPDLREKLESPTLDYGEDWLRLTCNIPARSSQAAITDQEWDAAELPPSGFAVHLDAPDDPPRVVTELPEGEIVDVGLDIAWKWDTTALVPLWLPRKDFRLFGDAVILEPPRDGTMLSAHEIEDAFVAINSRNPIRYVVMDREKGETIAQWLEETLHVEVIERGRTNEPASFDYERFMEGLRHGWIKHTGHEGLRRQAMNAVVRHLPSDKKRFDRPNPSRRNQREQDRRVIDALDAASMVHSVAVAELVTEPAVPLVALA